MPDRFWAKALLLTSVLIPDLKVGVTDTQIVIKYFIYQLPRHLWRGTEFKANYGL